VTLALRASGLSHVGVVRSTNQDSAFIGQRLLVMADGMGGHAGGDIASATAVKRIRELDADPALGPADLEETIQAAQRNIIDRVSTEPVLSGMGTTVTSLLLDGAEFTLAHIGDSRAYRLRDEKLEQISTDHTFVQHLIDTGRLAPEDAEKHPQRSVLLRVLGDVEGKPTLDMQTFPAQAGERWLLCSDGLSGVVDDAALHETLAKYTDRDECAQELVDLAIAGGGPDNITCIIADVVEIADGDVPDQSAVLGAAATTEIDSGTETPETGALAANATNQKETGAVPKDNDSATAEVHVPDAESQLAAEDNDPAAEEPKRGPVRRFFRGTSLLLILLILVAVAVWGGWKWTQTQWFIGDNAGKVAIFQGVPQDVGPWSLYEVNETSEVSVEDLAPYFRTRVDETLPASDLEDAQRILTNIREQTAP